MKFVLGEVMKIIGLLVGMAVAVSAAPSRASSIIYESAVANLSIIATSAGLSTYAYGGRIDSDSICRVAGIGDTDDPAPHGCGFGRAYAVDAGAEALGLSTKLWYDFVAPDASGWVSAQMAQYVDLYGWIGWWNQTVLEQTVSWTVAYELSGVSSPYNYWTGPAAFFKVEGYKDSEAGGTVPLPACANVTSHSFGTGVLGCSVTLAPGEYLDLYMETSAVIYLAVAEADVAPVPLSASGFLLLTGLGLLGAARARRRR